MAGLGPLEPLTGYPVDVSSLSPAQRQGGPADPLHGQYGWEVPEHYPYEYQHGAALATPPPVEMELISSIPPITVAGTPGEDPLFDYQPDTHSSPWPAGVDGAGDRDPVQYAARAAESARLHAADMNASPRYSNFTHPQIGQWENIDLTSVGTSLQVRPPEQSMNSFTGWGNTDRIQSLAVQNEHDYDAAHLHRRMAHDPIPGDELWIIPGGRPIVLNQPHTAVAPIGRISPFSGQDLDATFATDQAAPLAPPTAYAPPADPRTEPTQGPAEDPGPVQGWI